MYTLRLLGTASIEASHGMVTGRAAQGRRLALLALLALARGRALSRDKIVALLWPEATAERARPQLSDTLYILRHALGEDVVRSEGDGLTLNDAVMTSDVALFGRLLAEERLAEAAELYGGPLLDGFHVPDSVEFESWLDGERAQLDRQYAQALDTLAESAEQAGTPDVALGWWRRRAAHDPCNGRVAVRLMLALDAVGDRAGALQHARIHEVLLREQLDAEPDAAVTALADRLRHEPQPAPARPPEPARTPLLLPATTAAPLPSAEASAPPAEPAAMAGARRRRSVTSVAAAAVLVVLALGTAWGLSRIGDTPASARSVGVLPFVNMSADPANTYFSDGLSEQIILALSRIDGLRVAARTSSFALRHRDLGVRAIADTLDVQAVLEGSVLLQDGQLRVIAQLIDARTGYHIWSEQYDGELRDAFAVQDRIAAAIADALHLRLAGSTAPVAARTPSLEAYDLYLRGLYLRNGLSAEGLRQASDYFDRVIALEPGFALAYAAKASVVAPQAYFRYAPRDSIVAELRVLTARALQLDPTLGEAYVSLGVLKLFYEWDWDAAGAALNRAIELNPSDAHAWHHLANYFNAVGSLADAIAARETAVQLDPLNPRSRILLSREYCMAGEYDGALEQARRAAQFDPAHPLLLGTGASLPIGPAEVYLRQGRNDEAVEEYLRLASLRGATATELQDMRDAYATAGMRAFWRSWLEMDLRQSGPSPDPARMSATMMMVGDTAQVLDWLDRAFNERSPALIYLRRDATMSGMLPHPRVQRIVAAMKFPD